MKNNILRFAFPSLVTVIFMLGFYYFALPAINVLSFDFWVMIVLSALVFFAVFDRASVYRWLGNWFKYATKDENGQKSKKRSKGKSSGANNDYIVNANPYAMPRKIKITLYVILAVIAVVILVMFFSSSRLTRARSYQKMLTVSESDFSKDIAEISISQIPIVDRDTAERLGSRKIGEVVDLVSQFNVSDYYTQINYLDKPYRVSPLEYAGFLKWISNADEGIPYYVSIDMATQQTELVKLDEGMKYSPSEYFGRDLMRHIRFANPTKLLGELSFEIDDNGRPFWVISYYTFTIGIVGGKDVAGVIVVDAVSGEMTDYPKDAIPQWIDRAYSAELVVEQANNWGSLANGFFNSIFVQKGVVVTTEGYNYIAVDGDVWLYTGITSVVSDESNIGFILINMRTKEAKTYMINGAEEYSAMESAQGQIQEKGYTATFPILLNIANRPTYFISLKDNAGLVKAYAFVSVSDYQIVGVADKISDANAEYRRMLGLEVEDEVEVGDTVEYEGEIVDIASAVKNGNTLFYMIIRRTDVAEPAIYTADIRVSDALPFIKVGDKVTFSADDECRISKIKIS